MKRLLLLILIVCVTTVADARQWQYKKNTTVSVGATAGGFDSEVINGAGHAQANVASCVPSVAIWFTVDGTTPVASSNGQPVAANVSFVLDGNDILTAFSAIRDTSSGSLYCVVAAQ